MKCSVSASMEQCVTKQCLYCGDEFQARTKALKRGYGLFCSVKCQSRFPYKDEYQLCKELNAGNALEDTRCPFTIERLRSMYWHEGMSLGEIAQVASVTRGTISAWMKLAGISARNYKEAARTNIARRPEYGEQRRASVKATIEKYKNQGKKWGGDGSPIIRDIAKKGRKVIAKQRRATRVMFECAMPGCNKSFWRHPCRYKNYKRMYCCVSHSTKHQWMIRRENAEQALLKQRAEKMLGRKLD